MSEASEYCCGSNWCWLRVSNYCYCYVTVNRRWSASVCSVVVGLQSENNCCRNY